MQHSLKLTAIAVSFFSHIACAQSDIKIIGGENASANTWPSIVALVNKGQPSVEDGFFCGGSLIAPNLVLTAAHCVGDTQPNQLQVYVGSQSLRSGGTLIDVALIKANTDFGSSSIAPNDGDIALIVLKNAVDIPLQPIATAQEVASIDAQTMINIIGWGDTDITDGVKLPSTLQQAQVPLLDNAICQTVYEEEFTDNMFCAGFYLSGGGVDTCQGDSGGPVLANVGGVSKQIGIVSWGDGCASEEFPGVYTQLSQYQAWINSMLYSPDLAFSAVDIQPYVQQQDWVLLNNTLQAVSLQTAQITGFNANSFSIIDDDCSQQTLQAGEECHIRVRFNSTSSSVQQASIVMTDTLANRYQASLEGYGVNTALANALEMDSAWISGGDSAWVVTGTTSVDGVDAAASGSIADGEQSWIGTQVNIQTTSYLHFNWKVSSEERQDWLELYVDGELIDDISGAQDWVQGCTQLSAGTHQIMWKYSKDGSVALGADKAWLDQISVSSEACSSTGGSSSKGSSGGGSLPFWMLSLGVLGLARRFFR